MVSRLRYKADTEQCHFYVKFLLVASLAESLLNFRGPLIAALQTRGLEVHVVAPHLVDGHPVRLELEGNNVKVHTLKIARTGMNPLYDMVTLWSLYRLMVRVEPQFVLGYTIKPVVYGLLAARFSSVPKRYALITGLGFAFQGDGSRGRVQSVVQFFYRLALSGAHKVFFQNVDDELLFRQRRILTGRVASCVVNGSGVDTEKFAATPFFEGPLQFLLIARLLGDKGVREYVLSARRIRRQYPQVRFVLVGWIDENPDAIGQS
jgi:glycosyltransferase involved in cell wall biosynthesis